MLLKIDTTKREEVIVELIDKKSGRHDKLIQTQKIGSQVLLPMVMKILKKNQVKFDDLTAVEVNPGPGSFTGTRVGVAIANALAFALDIKVNDQKPPVFPTYSQEPNITKPKLNT